MRECAGKVEARAGIEFTKPGVLTLAGLCTGLDKPGRAAAYVLSDAELKRLFIESAGAAGTNAFMALLSLNQEAAWAGSDEGGGRGRGAGRGANGR